MSCCRRLPSQSCPTPTATWRCCKVRLGEAAGAQSCWYGYVGFLQVAFLHMQPGIVGSRSTPCYMRTPVSLFLFLPRKLRNCLVWPIWAQYSSHCPRRGKYNDRRSRYPWHGSLDWFGWPARRATCKRLPKGHCARSSALRWPGWSPELVYKAEVSFGQLRLCVCCATFPCIMVGGTDDLGSYTLCLGISSAAIYSVLEPISDATGLTLSDLNSGTGYMVLKFSDLGSVLMASSSWCLGGVVWYGSLLHCSMGNVLRICCRCSRPRYDFRKWEKRSILI